jgi:RimJ/RimL family protein N-acetyltransferase
MTAAGDRPRDVTPIAAQRIRTPRLDLLPLQVGHAAEMASVLADPALHDFIGGAPLGPAELQARYQRLVAGSADPAVSWCNWVILLRGEGCLTGTVQATITGVGAAEGGATGEDGATAEGGGAAEGGEAEIAWVVGTPWQGQGIATEAARGLVGWLWQQSAGVVTACIHPDHGASAAVAAAAGLQATDRWSEGEVVWRRQAPAGRGN